MLFLKICWLFLNIVLLGVLGCLVHGLCHCEIVAGTSHSRAIVSMWLLPMVIILLWYEIRFVCYSFCSIIGADLL
jgi:hypothetical protein